MESQQPQRQAAAAGSSEVDVEGGKGVGSGGSSGGMGCNKQCSRWTPTTEQIRILKDLYYNNGVRSPSAEQIQRISARLRQYGKIEGKNVFYWFQNHKARERQKKRFTVEQPHHHRVPVLPPPPPMQVQIAGNGGSYCWPKPDQDSAFQINKCQPLCAAGGVSSSGLHHSSSPGLFAAGVGQNFGSFGGTSYGSGTVPSFRDRSSISSAGGSGVGGCISNNFKWVGIDPYAPSYAPFGTRNSQPSPFELNHHHQQYQVPQSVVQEYQEEQEDDHEDDEDENDDDEEEEEEEEAECHHPEIQTLPLFPVHGDGRINKLNSDRHNAATYDANIHGGSGLASLELSLCSLAGRSNST